ncbi:GntR family transcriptional regulator [Terribacillus aidingensis]|uniref:GntR family transcriptional regulator n=1 Tax=Terribacillus aidingensis TaxID=586416 RepID=A0A285N528_9BACI|nr:GntR family transcriptional regulator [Terribacillus aidingensis]SNZ04043.1 GntR family transcriptional regulator [Terribacillus aidingensis]
MKIKSLYKTIYDDLVSKIMSGYYKEGQKLPSEKELDQLYHASRTPVRQALSKLESDGFIYRLQGRGSFVSDNRPKQLWTRMTGFTNYYLSEWEKITSRTIDVEKVPAPAAISPLLKLTDGDSALLTKMTRIRFYEGDPIIYLQHYLHPRFPVESLQSNENFFSIAEILNEEFQVKVARADEEIEAIMADDYLKDVLQLDDAHTPLIKVTRTSYTAADEPLDVNVYYVNSKRWKFEVSFRQSEKNFEFF